MVFCVSVNLHAPARGAQDEAGRSEGWPGMWVSAAAAGPRPTRPRSSNLPPPAPLLEKGQSLPPLPPPTQKKTSAFPAHLVQPVHVHEVGALRGQAQAAGKGGEHVR